MQAAPNNTTTTLSTLDRPTILLVDDDATLRRGLSRVLERKGYAVYIAANGPEALALAERHLPDLALVDLGLPGMDGFEVIAALRERLGNSIHSAVLSGQSSLEQRVKAFDAGADDFIPKPVDMTELIKKLDAAQRTQAITRDAIRGRAKAEQLQLFNSEASSLLAHDINNGISIVLANIQYLSDTAHYDEDQLDAARASERALKRISVLSNNFVDISRFEDGVLSPQRTPTDIGQLLRTTADVHEPRGANEEGLITVDCSRGFIANVDGILLERVLHNLIGNALRYARGGFIEISAAESTISELVITVSNSGAEIPASLQPVLFDKYRAGEDGKAMRGMGLYFCRMACEAHSGGISVTSAQHKTTFTIRIPNVLSLCH